MNTVLYRRQSVQLLTNDVDKRDRRFLPDKHTAGRHMAEGFFRIKPRAGNDDPMGHRFQLAEGGSSTTALAGSIEASPFHDKAVTAK